MGTSVTYALSCVLILGGMLMLGFAFNPVTVLPGLIFAGGVLAICLGFAIPTMIGRHGLR